MIIAMARGFSLLTVVLLCGVGVVTAQPPDCPGLDIRDALNNSSPFRGELCKPRPRVQEQFCMLYIANRYNESNLTEQATKILENGNVHLMLAKH